MANMYFEPPAQIEARPPFLAQIAVFLGYVVVAVMLAAAMVAYAHAAPIEAGKASFYSRGQHTASGQRFNLNAMTCAHRTAPFGTELRVQWGSREVICKVNDRGPFIRGRVVDLSLGAARALGMVGRGVVPVTVTRLHPQS